MTPKLEINKRLEIVRQMEKGASVVDLSKKYQVSRQLLYRWYKRYKNEGRNGVKVISFGRPKKEIQVTKKINKLSPLTRKLMCEEVVNQNSRPTEVAQKYNISRPTLYKWINRYKEDVKQNVAPDLSSRTPSIERYYRQTPDNYEQAVLSLVSKNPKWGIRKLVANLPQVAGKPIVGHHGVQNILRRNDLSTHPKRIEYTQSIKTPVTSSIENILSHASSFFSIETEKRHVLVRFFTVFFITSFSVVATFGILNYFVLAERVYQGISKVGLSFATLALVMGSVFFLYSMKYYITLAIVLSYSQKEGVGMNGKGERKKGLLDWLLGVKKEGVRVKNRPVGLEPDLRSISLSKKPFVSVHIPFYNEKYVVERSIKAALDFDYPEYEVILCDDSTDETTDIIRNYQRKYLLKGETLKEQKGDGWSLTSTEVRPGVTLKHLHRTTRLGFKGGALNLALSLVNPKTEHITVFDADFVPYPDTLELFLKYFKIQNNMSEDLTSSNVAAVQGYQWHVLNKSENWITRGIRSEYAGSYVIERSGTEIYQGLKQISGSVYMIRRDVLNKLGWKTSITEDFELTLRLYEQGYKVVYTPYVQAPAECVSTLKRLVRQRMRWSEGHSQNIKKMFAKLMLSSKLSFTEKFELLYLSPYYLQAAFFLVGTFAWFISEAVFRTHLPFWTELWGWSLVLTNMISLPLLNAVGLFLEESEEKDYLGLASFVALSYILVPFQAYASIKGFLEKEEGTWFRTPKTGKITDVFTRGKFYRFIQGILPGKETEPAYQQQNYAYQYLNLKTANNKFNSFNITKRNKWAAKLVLVILLTFSTTLYSLSRGVTTVEATPINKTLYIESDTSTIYGTSDQLTNTSSGTCYTSQGPKNAKLTNYILVIPGTVNNQTPSHASGGSCPATPAGDGWIYDTQFDSNGTLDGQFQFTYYTTDNAAANVGYVRVCAYKTNATLTSSTLLFQATGTTDYWIGGTNNFTDTFADPCGAGCAFDATQKYLLFNFYVGSNNGANSSAASTTFGSEACGTTSPRVVIASFSIPENAIAFLVAAPILTYVILWMKKRREVRVA